MTVSIPKPNWRGVQQLFERATTKVARLGGSSVEPAARTDREQTVKTTEWSAVMTATSATAPAIPAPAAPVRPTRPAGPATAESAAAVTAEMSLVEAHPAEPATASPTTVSPTTASPTTVSPTTASPTAPRMATKVGSPAADRPVATDRPAKAARVRESRPARELNTAWVLPAMLLVVCLLAVGWTFSHGTAAAAWLIALIAFILAGVPIALVAMRLFGYEDPD